MLGELFNVAMQFIQNNPGMVTVAGQKACNEITNSIERKRQEKIAEENARKVANEEAKRRDEAFFNDAIQLEKMRILKSDPRTEKFPEDILLKFSEERLRNNLPQRISELEVAIEELNSKKGEIRSKLSRLRDMLAAVKMEKTAYDKEKDEYLIEMKKCERYNNFYHAYIRTTKGGAELDDFAKLEIMFAAKEFGIDDNEVKSIAEFARNNNFDDTTLYRELPARPREKEFESEVDLTRQIAQSDKELVDLDKQIEKLVGIVSALRSRNCGIKIDVNNQSPPSALNDANKNEIGEAENLEGKVGEIIFDAFEWAEDADDIYLGEDIPDDKLDNATEKMQPLEDSVFILLDSTVFGSAEEGMILTSKAAYFKNLFEDPVRFTWSELSEAKYTEDGEVVVGEYSFASGKNEDFANNLASSLCCIAHQLKDLGLVPVGGVRNNNPQIIKCPNCGVDVHVSSKNCWSCDYELH